MSQHTNENIRIRKASINDTDLIVKLGIQTQSETFLKDNKPDVFEAYINETFNKEIIEKELSDENSTYYITEKEDITHRVLRTIGYMKIRRNNVKENKLAGENSIELQRIYIVKSEKGNGYGKIQLEFCENIAKTEGFDIIWLGVWEKNHFAIEFYKRNGYEMFSSHAFMFGGEVQNDFMMRKLI
jgi:diamine N-acetyltransferase